MENQQFSTATSPIFWRDGKISSPSIDETEFNRRKFNRANSTGAYSTIDAPGVNAACRLISVEDSFE
jgi:hypothetical protein